MDFGGKIPFFEGVLLCGVVPGKIPGKSLPETPLFDGRTDHSLPVDARKGAKEDRREHISPSLQ
jgi:hypothetical protein